MLKNKSDLPTINDVELIEGRGPWASKSGGNLDVLFAIPQEELLSRYFNYGDYNPQDGSPDVRGLRAYTVSDIPEGVIGANEWHELRNELVFALNGKFRWTCEDINGDKKEVILEHGASVWTPPYILHTYESLAGSGNLLVIASTLFIPEDPATHDSYPAESFHELQAQYVLEANASNRNHLL